MSSSNSLRQSVAWIGVLLLLAVTAWFGWKALRDTEPATGPGGGGGARPPRTVIVRPATAQNIVQLLPVNGTLRAVRRAEVAARESAAVNAISVNEGDLVKTGDVIALLDSRRLDAQAQEATAALTSAGADLAQRKAEHQRAIEDEEMMRGLWDQRAVSEREFLDTVRELKVAAARENAATESIAAASKRFDLLEVRRNDLEVKAPFDGRVVARHTELGEWLQEGDPVITLLSTGEAEAWLQIPERHVALLKQTSPDSVELKFPGSNEPIQADKLSLVPDVEGRSRSFHLIAHLPDPENRLTPGTSVQASVPLGKPENRIVISADAVLLSYSGTYVFIPEKSSAGPPLAKRVPVTVLFERNGDAVLAPGDLKAGDQVIVEGNERLFPNTPLDPKPWSETRAQGPETASPAQ